MTSNSLVPGVIHFNQTRLPSQLTTKQTPKPIFPFHFLPRQTLPSSSTKINQIHYTNPFSSISVSVALVTMEDIAVVGIGLRFPGEASCPEDFWKVLERGESQWSEFPDDRLNINGYFHPGGDRQGSISFRGAHFLKGDFAAFDAPFFSVAAEDAKAIDPQQRILLEASYEALENAGIRKEDIDGSDAAVYVGSFVKDYEQVCLRDPDWQPQYAATGNGIAIMANRISYFFNLHGPSMTIDTGCSGSLVAVHLAAQSLRNGETSLAIAAGAGMILTPNTIMPMTALNFLSPDGKCFTFDSRANGYGRGEGIGVVVLKRLSDALRDNDTIRAVIRGTRVNQDGHTTGITLPSKEAQVANIRGVYQAAGLDFNQTAYVECHGTGTQAGDWRELKAVSESLASTRSVDNPIFVGSVKPNIGHLEGAAGVAGLIKGILTLERGKIPPNINFENGNPNIDFHDWRVKVPTKMSDWPLPDLRRVSVNCFGFGGTNAHVIMDEAPRYLSSRGLVGNHNSFEGTPSSNGHRQYRMNGFSDRNTSSFDPQLLCYASHEKVGLERVMKSHIPHLASKQNDIDDNFLRHYSYTLGCRRSELEWKGFVVATSVEDLVSKLQASEPVAAQRTSQGKQPKLCFIFGGQGAQWAQMGKDLMPFDAFRESLEAAALFMNSKLKSPFDIIVEMFKEPAESRISDPEITQPATTALQVALVDLLDSFRVRPKYVVGHSSGEVAAAYASGAISREAAWETAYYRGYAAYIIPLKNPSLRGAMLAVGISSREAEGYLRQLESPVEIACINSPRSVTLSGNAGDIEEVCRRLAEGKVFHRKLHVKTAYHSSQMKIVEEDYRAFLRNVSTEGSDSTATMFSSVLGKAVQSSTLDRHYWVKNMTMPVRYVDAVEAMMSLPVSEQPDIIIELSPAAALKSPTLDILGAQSRKAVPSYHAVLDRKNHSAVSLLNVMGELWARGYSMDMKNVVSRGVYEASLKVLTDLPPYPWNHSKSYWHESHLGKANRFREFGRQDLIGAPTADAISFEPRWRGFLRISENPWIQDHQVQKTIVYPAAGMVAMVLEGACQVTKDKTCLQGYEIIDMSIEKAMIIPSTAHGLEMAMNFKHRSGSQFQAKAKANLSYEFTIYSKQLDGPWEQHASGILEVRYTQEGSHTTPTRYKNEYQILKASCTSSIAPRQLYEHLDIVGMNYGTLFQNITEISRGGRSCVSKVCVPDTQSKMPAKYEYPHLIHPATLDAMFQTLFSVDSEPMVPTHIKSLFVSAGITREIGSEFSGYAVAERTGIRDASARIVMSQSGWDHPTVIIDGLYFTSLSSQSPEEGGFLPNHRNLCTEVVWEEDVSSAKPQTLGEMVTLLVHKYPGISILQIGGDSHFMKMFVEILSQTSGEALAVSRYTIADGYHDFEADVLPLIKDTNLKKCTEVRKIDGSELLPEYHLILACDCESIQTANLYKHLSPGGLLLCKCCKDSLDGNAVRFDLEVPDKMIQFSSHRQQTSQEMSSPADAVILVPESRSPAANALISNLTRVAKSQKPELELPIVNWDEILSNPSCIRDKFVISLIDIATEERQYSIYHWDESEFNTFHALQKFSKGIVWVVRSAHRKTTNPRASPIISLARTLMSEDPLKTIVTLDIARQTRTDDEELAKTIMSIFDRTFRVHVSPGTRETEYAEDNGRLYIPRLRPISVLNKLVEFGDTHEVAHKQFNDTERFLRLGIKEPGIHDRHLFQEFTPSEAPEPGEIEVIFKGAALTHLDLETLMGRTTDSNIGMDFFGVVGQVGRKESVFKPGDHVSVLVDGGAIQNTLIVNERFVKLSNSRLPLSHYVSAAYAFLGSRSNSVRRTVLIHAGASAFGLAAIEMARALKYDMYVTVMGTDCEDQRATLLKMCVQGSCIIDGNSDAFINTIRDKTNGKGVDIVYNSTREHVESTFKCVRKNGLVFQFASKAPNPSPIRASSASFINFDLSYLLREDPDDAVYMLNRTVELLDTSRAASTRSDYLADLSQLPEMFRHIETSPYLGRSTLVCDEECQVPVALQAYTKTLEESLSGDKTYVLAGGLGGLGRCICELLVQNGVNHVAFLSRSGASSDSAKSILEELELRRIDARVYQVDICDEEALMEVIWEKIHHDMPPVHGVLQCAAVIKDAVFDNMSYSDWTTAFRPKAIGSENLVRSFSGVGEEQPFFVFLASSAGVIGTRGQANYAAGNCFEDALARCCREGGTHAVSIDLGPILGAGMLAEDEEVLDMLRASGFYGIRYEDFLRIITHAITTEIASGVPMPPQVVMGVVTGGIIRQNQPADPYWSRTALYSHLNLVDMPPPDLSMVGGSATVDMKSMLACSADADAASEIVTIGLSQMLAKAMNMLPEEIDSRKPPNVYGVDSLVAVGVRNWVHSNCGVELSVFEVLSDKTIAELATDIVTKGRFGTEKS